MALITDPDQLNQATEITIDATTEEITLNLAGLLSEDGVTGQALYSFLKEEWKSDAALIKYTFPMLAITPEQFEFGNNGSKFSNWVFADAATRKLVRTAGWREYDSAGTTLAEYLGVITLGNIDAVSKTVGDKAYFFFASDTTSTAFTYAGAVNEVVQIFGDAANGNFDVRSELLSLNLRQQAKKYGASTTSEIGVATMTYKVERFPLGEEADTGIVTADIGIDATADGIADVAPYTGMSITYLPHQNLGTWASATTYVAGDVVQSSGGRWFYTAAGGTSAGNDSDLAGASDSGVTWVIWDGEFAIGSTFYSFGVAIDGNGATKEQVYEFVQWSLRQDVDIDAGAGSINGLLAEDLVLFAAGILTTLRQSDGSGVFVDNISTADTNFYVFTDDSASALTFPFEASGKLQFNTNLVNDVAAEYWVFFKNANGNLIDSAAAIIVNDATPTPITGLVTGAAEINFSFDYDGNVQGGRTAATDAIVVIRAMGLITGQFVEAEFTITRSTGLVFPLTAALERNYLNA